MAKGYGNRGTSDVIVNLIPISTTVESGDTGRKRKRDAESAEGLLASLNLHSERLRRCSKYFKILLGKRWSDSNTKSLMEFFLEVHTDVKFYEDCFSRMYAPNFTGIPSVDHALELLKVASQIEFMELIRDAVCYLSLAPWSDVEDTKIREFPFSTYISAGGLSDLNDRLLLEGSKEESCRCLYEVGQDYLSSSLETALKSVANSETAKQTSSAMFEKAFFEIVQSGSCYTFAKDTFALVNKKAKELLLKTAEAGKDSGALESNFKMLCWLFKILLNARGAKKLVMYLLFSKLWGRLYCVFSGGSSELFTDFEWSFQWAHTMLSIFEEVLAGRLLLNSSMRVRLFDQWKWFLEFLLLNKDKDEVVAAKLTKTLSSFMMTLPHEIQTDRLKEWLSKVDDDDTGVSEVLELAHSMWMKDLQRNLVALESARASGIVAKTQDQASSPPPASSKSMDHLAVDCGSEL